MRRKNLEKTAPTNGTSLNTEKALEVQVLEDGDRKILEIDIYNKGKLQARHFLDKDRQEYATLFTADVRFMNAEYKKDCWSDMKLESLLAEGDFYMAYYKAMKEGTYTAESLKITEKYLEEKDTFWKEEGGLQRLVIAAEDEVTIYKKERSLENKENRINGLMAKVETITDTEEFQKWIKEEVFAEDYIFVENKKMKSGYRCRCTACNKTFFAKEKPKHNKRMICPKCKKDVLIKTRVSQVTEKESVLVAQQYNEKIWMLRHFRFEAVSEIAGKKTEKYITHTERVRIFIFEGKKNKIYYRCDKKFGSTEKTQVWWDSKNGMVIDKNFLLYPGNLPELKIDRKLKSTLRKGAACQIKMDYNTMIRCWKSQPYIEYLIKSGLFKLADELVRTYGYWARPNELLDMAADSITGLLQIDKQRVNRLRNINGGRYTLEMLQVEERDGIKITQENLEFADKYKVWLEDLETERTKLGINKAINYFRRQMEKNEMNFRQIKQYYHDYLDMAAERGADLTDDIIRINARMIEFHMQYLEEKNRKANKIYAEKMNKKYPNIEKKYEENCNRFEWENDKFIIRVPQNCEDI
ncbi:MAG: hypothetical protein HFJ09_09680, partial [Lachnospiraceae bacterium]|nr:hypothetical protein [Lachnospiraceae bacterium]